MDSSNKRTNAQTSPYYAPNERIALCFKHLAHATATKNMPSTYHLTNCHSPNRRPLVQEAPLPVHKLTG